MTAAAAAPAPDDDDPLALRLLYSPHTPTPPQAAFLKLGDLGVRDALYGGAAGGGKSDALLMAALQYVDVPGYAAIILRKTFADLSLPGAIMDRAKTWLAGTDARWNDRDSRFTFPSTATLSFGYLQHANDRYRYASAEFQFIAFDELTQFPKPDFTFLFSRLRRPSGVADDNPLAKVPLRMRAASNPGGIGHEWVKDRYIIRKPDPDDPEDTAARARSRIFIGAKLHDNPHVDQKAYIQNLQELDPFLRQQMLDGDWDADEPGDWVYDRAGLRAAWDLGEHYDNLLANGTMPPPAGPLAVGIDWGEDAAILLGWPLERGGIYFADELTLASIEAAQAAQLVVDMLTDMHARASRPRPPGWEPDLSPAELVAAKRRPGAIYPPAIRPDLKPAHLVREHRYDGAGISSQRTYIAAMRRHNQQAVPVRVGFGDPAPRSGKSAPQRSYKAETLGYIRRVVERTLAGDDIAGFVEGRAKPEWDAERRELEVRRIASAGKLAISHRCKTTYRQMQKLEWLDRAAGTVRKGDDHNADAAIALLAPVMTRHR